MTNQSSLFNRILGFSVVLALIVIVLGAYTRLSDAGLGCPDWPGCYGQLSVPESVSQDKFKRPLEVGKAWKEMIHRYVAGTLGLMVLLILFIVSRYTTQLRQSMVLPLVLLTTVVFQALLGMWTVTLLLSPLIVTAHLIGGFTTLSLLWWLLLNQQKANNDSLNITSFYKLLTVLGLLIVIFQILLGGWTSTNYAALACGTDFPKCASEWLPVMDFASAFELSHKPGVDYEFGILESPARTAIQFSHRVGALIVFIYLSGFGLSLLKRQNKIKKLGVILLVILLLQLSLGIMNVVLGLPILIAVLHNLVAAMLLLTMLAITHLIIRSSQMTHR